MNRTDRIVPIPWIVFILRCDWMNDVLCVCFSSFPLCMIVHGWSYEFVTNWISFNRFSSENLYARSASTESWIDSEEFRRNDGNLDQVQGVHTVKEQLSVEESEQRSARSVGRVSFKEILRSEFVEIPEMLGVHMGSK